MTTLEALQILQSKQPTELTPQEVVALRAFLDEHPEIALTVGGRDHVEQFMAIASAYHDDADAVAALVEHAADELTATAPTAEENPPPPGRAARRPEG